METLGLCLLFLSQRCNQRGQKLSWLHISWLMWHSILHSANTALGRGDKYQAGAEAHHCQQKASDQGWAAAPGSGCAGGQMARGLSVRTGLCAQLCWPVSTLKDRTLRWESKMFTKDASNRTELRPTLFGSSIGQTRRMFTLQFILEADFRYLPCPPWIPHVPTFRFLTSEELNSHYTILSQEEGTWNMHSNIFIHLSRLL